MTDIDIIDFSNNIYYHINRAIKNYEVIKVHSKKGNVVIMSSEEYNDMMNALYCGAQGNNK